MLAIRHNEEDIMLGNVFRRSDNWIHNFYRGTFQLCLVAIDTQGTG